MEKNASKVARYSRRKRSIRNSIEGSAARPRLSVFRSNSHIYAQVINDEQGVTLAAASSRSKTLLAEKAKGECDKKSIAKMVGQELAKNAKAAGVETVVFDRNGFKYHGRVAALADGARDGGLDF
jgi:large subunit ribosomal protein L18